MSRKSVEIVNNIYLLKIPFESVFTSVFFVVEKDRLTIYDTGTYESDVTEYIIPELEAFAEKGVNADKLVVSHFHGDHSGGVRSLLENYKNLDFYAENRAHFEAMGFCPLKVYDGIEITENICLYIFPGHSDDCVALFDKRTKTLLSADAFQGYGILRYGVCGDIEKWCESISKAEKMDIINLISSHEYFPVGQISLGENQAKKYLADCRNCFAEMAEYYLTCTEKGISDFEEVARRFCEENKRLYPNFPTISANTFESVVRLKDLL